MKKANKEELNNTFGGEQIASQKIGSSDNHRCCDFDKAKENGPETCQNCQHIMFNILGDNYRCKKGNPLDFVQ